MRHLCDKGDRDPLENANQSSKKRERHTTKARKKPKEKRRPRKTSCLPIVSGPGYPITKNQVSYAVLSAQQLQVKMIVLPFKEEYCNEDILQWLQMTGRELVENNELLKFINHTSSMKSELDELQNSFGNSSLNALKRAKTLFLELQKANQTIEKVGLTIIHYIKLLNRGWNDGKRVISLQEIEDFVSTYGFISETVDSLCDST